MGGTDPKILIRLYKVYVRSIFEYGSVCFVHSPDSTLDIMQKIQNRAIRICLRLPRYVSLKLLHESACLPMIKVRLLQLSSKMVTKMKVGNPASGKLISEREARSHPASPLKFIKGSKSHLSVPPQPSRCYPACTSAHQIFLHLLLKIICDSSYLKY